GARGVAGGSGWPSGGRGGGGGCVPPPAAASPPNGLPSLAQTGRRGAGQQQAHRAWAGRPRPQAGGEPAVTGRARRSQAGRGRLGGARGGGGPAGRRPAGGRPRRRRPSRGGGGGG